MRSPRARACTECAVGFYGPHCLPCALDCGEHGRCNDGSLGDGRCICMQGYAGYRCQHCAKGYWSCGGTCMDAKCDGMFCGSDTNARPDQAGYECVSGNCTLTCQKSVFNWCVNCRNQDCTCAPMGA